MTELQKKKLTKFFETLDFNKNGIIQEDDFVGIAENLCLLWYADEAQEKQVISSFREDWVKLNKVLDNTSGQITLDQWLTFADQFILKGNKELFNKYIDNMASEVIHHFDEDGDGYLSLDEFVDLFVAYRIEVRHSAKTFTKLDRNLDDQISKDEIALAFKQYFLESDPKKGSNMLFGELE